MKFAVERNLEYARAGGKSLSLDLYLPRQPAKPLPAIVWIHSEEGPFAGKYPSPVVRMVGHEYAVASIDYRSFAEAGSAGQIEDCRAAIRWLRANAGKYGLDADHIAAWGLSEGGRLAALLGTPAGLKEADPSSRVQAVVDFSGPAGMGKDKGLDPARYVTHDGPPFLILHGDRDKTVPARESQLLDSALRKASADATLRVVQGAGHDFKQLRQGESADVVDNFLDQHLKGGTHVRYWLGKIDPPSDAWVDPIVDEPVGTQYKTFAAPALGAGGQASYLIYLPPDYEKARTRRYPVVYYLHGGGGSQRVGDIWVQKLDTAIKEGQAPALIAVLIEGLPEGRFLDSADGKTPIESVIMKDLLPHIDATYRTIPRREARALEGLSMGGYGAFHLGFKYPEVFGMISGLCNGVSAPGGNSTAPGRPPATASDLAANPFVLAEKNLAAIRGRMTIRVIVGTEDFTLAANEAFHAQLTKLDIPHEYKILEHVSHGYKEYYERLDFRFFKTIATE